MVSAGRPEAFAFKELLRLMASDAHVRVGQGVSTAVDQVCTESVGRPATKGHSSDQERSWRPYGGVAAFKFLRTAANRFGRWVNNYGDSLGRRDLSRLRCGFHSEFPFSDVTVSGILLPCGPLKPSLSLHWKGLACINASHEIGYCAVLMRQTGLGGPVVRRGCLTRFRLAI